VGSTRSRPPSIGGLDKADGASAAGKSLAICSPKQSAVGQYRVKAENSANAFMAGETEELHQVAPGRTASRNRV
jgi:hypothetical protein